MDLRAVQLRWVKFALMLHPNVQIVVENIKLLLFNVQLGQKVKQKRGKKVQNIPD